MKNLFLSAALLFTSLIGYAQSASFKVEMQKGIDLLDTVKTEQGYATSINYLQKVAAANAQEWLAQYYAAYGNLMSGIRGKQDEETKDGIYSTALSYIDKANTLSPNNSEVYTLKAYIIFMQMAVYPTKRAMNMIPESNRLLEKAIELNMENPRSYLLKGQNTFYTPEMFGGGKEDAKAILLIAKDKFGNFKATALAPNWGKTRVEELLKEY